MLEIIGWVALIVIGIFISLSALVGAVLSGWITGVTIGGAYPTISERLLGIAIILGVLGYWYWVFTISPFTITVK